MSNVEKILVNYCHELEFDTTPLNAVGPTTSMTLRSITDPSGTITKYVRHSGLAYEIKSVSAIVTVPAGLTFSVYTQDGTLLGSQVGGGSFTPGTSLSSSQPSYLTITCAGTPTATGTSITLTTDVDGSGYSFELTNETIPPMQTYNFYLSYTGSTYYDSTLVHGGARHSPDGSSRLPFFHINDAISALSGSYDVVTVLDSATYDEDVQTNGATIQAALGQIPTITRGFGARTTREVMHDGNNTDTAYVSKYGSDSVGGGTWQNPYLTISHAYSNIGSRSYINIKDTAEYLDTLNLTTAVTLEPCYREMPWLIYTSPGGIIGINNLPAVYGMTIRGRNSSTIGISISSGADVSNSIRDNTLLDLTTAGIQFNDASHLFNGNINRNVVRNCNEGISINAKDASAGDISQNIASYCATAGILVFTNQNVDVTINNNLVHSCGTYGIGLVFAGPTPDHDFSGTVSYNTVTNCDIGFFMAFATFGGTITGNIFFGNKTWDILMEGTGNPTVTYSCFTKYGVPPYFTFGAGIIQVDPLFIDPDNFNFAIASDSPCHNTGISNSTDMGCTFTNIRSFASSSFDINGFILDGQYQYSKGHRNGYSYGYQNIKWCEVRNYQGIGLDEPTGGSQGGSITNTLVHNNGQGMSSFMDSINNNTVFTNVKFGIFMDAPISFNHNVIFNNQYGVYNLGFNVTTTNSIFYGNTVFDIYSDTFLLKTTNCDITGNVFNVDRTSGTNLDADPLFVSYDPNAPDFHLRSVQGGFIQPSSLVGRASDGYDMGAFLVSYATIQNNWNSYQFRFNPRKVTWTNTPKGVSIFENALGSKDLYMLNFKRSILMDWVDNVTNQADREKVDYFHTLQKNRFFTPPSEIVKFRLHMKPTAFEDSGTGATVNAVNKTLGDNTKTWNEDAWRGFHVGIKYETGANLVINASARTATDSSKNWTTDQWKGFYICIKSDYFYILSNTDKVLTLSDYYSQLVSQTLPSYGIEKYFKINSNTLNVLNLTDDNGELPTGNFNWYIDFMEVRIVDPTNTYIQDPFALFRQHNRGTYVISWEEM